MAEGVDGEKTGEHMCVRPTKRKTLKIITGRGKEKEGMLLSQGEGRLKKDKGNDQRGVKDLRKTKDMEGKES